MTQYQEFFTRRQIGEHMALTLKRDLLLIGYDFDYTLTDLATTQPPPTPGPTPLRPINPEAKALAIGAGLTAFRQPTSSDSRFKGGAHTWSFHAGEFGKAALAFTGDTDGDEMLINQIRHLLVPGWEPTCTGGFPDQKQVCATGMFLLAKHTPRIWDALSEPERNKIDRIMFCAATAGAYTCSDNNPNVLAKGEQRDLRGDVLGRDWNPNFQNGFVGQVILASIYFGPEELQAMWGAYDHADQIDSLMRGPSADHLPNIHRAWTEKPTVATAAQVESCIRPTFLWHNTPLNPSVMWGQLAGRCFSQNVDAGLNDGKGIAGSDGKVGGYLNTAAQPGLPNKGKLGMLHEFKTGDAGGKRSSHWYCRETWYVNLYLHYCLVATGNWLSNDPILDRIRIGSEDWFYKDKHGYIDFAHGKAKPMATIDDNYGRTINDDLYASLMEWHDANG